MILLLVTELFCVSVLAYLLLMTQIFRLKISKQNVNELITWNCSRFLAYLISCFALYLSVFFLKCSKHRTSFFLSLSTSFYVLNSEHFQTRTCIIYSNFQRTKLSQSFLVELISRLFTEQLRQRLEKN